MRILIFALIVTVANGCALGHLREAEKNFYEAQDILVLDKTTVEQDKLALQKLHNASAHAINALMVEDQSPVAYQILIESMFGLAELDPSNSQRYTLKAYTVSLDAFTKFPKSTLSSLFCYYIAKAMIGSNQRDMRVVPIVMDCTLKASMDQWFIKEYPGQMEHLRRLRLMIIDQHKLHHLYPRL